MRIRLFIALNFNHEVKAQIEEVINTVQLKDSYHAIEVDDITGKINIYINKVDLMKSEFVNGKLIHSVVYSRLLD